MDLIQKIAQPEYKFEGIIHTYQKYAKDPRPDEIHSEFDFGEEMFSSSGRGWNGWMPGEGVRFRPSIIESDKWRRYPLCIDSHTEAQIRSDCDKIIGAYYDWLGILGQPVAIHSPWWYYCSESLWTRLVLSKLREPRKVIRPGQIVDALGDIIE